MVAVAGSVFTGEHEDLIIAVGVVVLALVLVALLDRILRRWSRALVARMGGGELSRGTQTRLTFARRALDALIIVVAIAIALSRFDAVDAIGTALLTSSAITAAVLGFAARQTLANAIAGLMLAISQPIRIGDVITVEGQSGTVEDIDLIYTWLRTPADARILVPNERLATAVLCNDTIRSPTVAIEASVWLTPDADTDAALGAVAPLGAGRIAGTTFDGIELVVAGEPVPASERARREAELRAAALGALREAGVR